MARGSGPGGPVLASIGCVVDIWLRVRGCGGGGWGRAVARGRWLGGCYAGRHRLWPVHWAVRILGGCGLCVGCSCMARVVYAIGGGGLGGTMLAGVGSSLYASRLVRWVVAAGGGGLGFAVPAGVGGGLCTR